MLVLLELFNKVWGLTGCPFKGQTIRTNRSVRFDFCGGTVLLALRGDQVSFYTTVGVVVVEGRADFLYLPLSTLR